MALAVAKLADQAPFAKELAWAQDADHRFLALLGRDHNFDLALLDVENRKQRRWGHSRTR
jgi:hypothetical protein